MVKIINEKKKVDTFAANTYEMYAVVDSKGEIIKTFRLLGSARKHLSEMKSLIPWEKFEIKWVEEK